MRKDETKYIFADAIKSLMANQSLDKITVSQIVAETNLTRQTFYRHFKDKYDLVNWYFEKLCQKSFKQMGISLTLPEALIKKFQFLEQEKVFFSQAFQSQDYNSLVAYDYEMILQFYTNIIKKKLNTELPEDLLFLLEMYCRGSIDMTVNWATSGMKFPPEKISNLLIEALPKQLDIYLSDLT